MLDRDLGPINKTDIDGVLLATRAQDIIGIIPLVGDYYIVPESFQRGLYSHWGTLRRQGSREFFLLTERPFADDPNAVDAFLCHLPSRLIEYYLSQSSLDQVAVLDVGGGRDGTTARQVAQRYPAAEVINTDMVAIESREGNFTSKQGDLCNMDLPSRSITVAYSHQVLPYMGSPEDFSRPRQVIEEVARVLRPGGAGIIDFTNAPEMQSAKRIPDSILAEIEEGFDGRMVVNRKSYGGGFLFIARNPIDVAILNIGTQSGEKVN